MARPRKYPLPEDVTPVVDSQQEVKAVSNDKGTIAEALEELHDHRRRINEAIASLERL